MANISLMADSFQTPADPRQTGGTGHEAPTPSTPTTQGQPSPTTVGGVANSLAAAVKMMGNIKDIDQTLLELQPQAVIHKEADKAKKTVLVTAFREKKFWESRPAGLCEGS